MAMNAFPRTMVGGISLPRIGRIPAGHSFYKSKGIKSHPASGSDRTVQLTH